MADGNFQVIEGRIVATRGVIMKHSQTLIKWSAIKDKFLVKAGADDKLQVDRLLGVDEPKYGRIVLKTLSIWGSSQHPNNTFDNLIAIFKEFGLSDLIADLTNGETRRKIHDANLEEPLVIMDPRFSNVRNFKIRETAYQVAITIQGSREATEKWSTVKDAMVKNVPDNMKIDLYLERREIYQAIKETLDMWISSESRRANFHKLLGIFTEHGLAQLTGTFIKEAVHIRRLESDDSDINAGTETVAPAAASTSSDSSQPDGNPTNQQADAHQQYHTCPVCLVQPWDHMLTKCGHFICHECVERLRTITPGGRFNCHICREPFGAADVSRAFPPY